MTACVMLQRAPSAVASECARCWVRTVRWRGGSSFHLRMGWCPPSSARSSRRCPLTWQRLCSWWTRSCTSCRPMRRLRPCPARAHRRSKDSPSPIRGAFRPPANWRTCCARPWRTVRRRRTTSCGGTRRTIPSTRTPSRCFPCATHRGTVVIGHDVTDQEKAHRGVQALYAVRERVGQTLDVVATCQELVHALVPGFADIAVVEVVGACGVRRRTTAEPAGTGCAAASSRLRKRQRRPARPGASGGRCPRTAVPDPVRAGTGRPQTPHDRPALRHALADGRSGAGRSDARIRRTFPARHTTDAARKGPRAAQPLSHRPVRTTSTTRRSPSPWNCPRTPP
jgi:hypothetical protein